MSFNISFFKPIYLTFDEKPLLIAGYLGKIKFDLSNFDFIKSVWQEAQRKYERMHFSTSSVRFDKSWTGEVGEQVVKHVFASRGIEIIQRKRQIIHGYDGGDLLIKHNNREMIVNVSSRKLSKNDNVLNVVIKPDEYYCLIPAEQIGQYVDRSQLAVFVFILGKTSEKCQIENDFIDVFTEIDFIVPGYLSASDLKALKDNNYVNIKQKGEKLRGLYNSLSYPIPMYTNNYVIPLSFLKKFTIENSTAI
jgi:hypothetical protein